MFRPNRPQVGYKVPDYQERVYCSSIQYYEDLYKDIAAAETSIDFETFIFSDDKLAHKVAMHLCQAAERGVKVRLMIDGMGALLSKQLQNKMIATGIELKIFHPAPWRFSQWKYSDFLGRFIFRKLLYFVTHINQRNHRKVIIIDDHIAWIGSINVTIQHLPKEAGGDGWCDTAVRLEDLNYMDLTRAFEAEFYHQHFSRLFGKAVVNRIFRLNNTLFRRRKIFRTLLRKLRRAKRKIWICNAYFVPDRRLLRSLKEAAWMGVMVRIILPMNNNHIFMGWASSVFYTELLEAGVKIYEYQYGMLHSKTMIVDEWMIIGSSNLNSRSLFSDYEVDVVLGSEKAQVDLQNQMVDLIEESREVCLGEFKKFGRSRRMLGHIIMFFRHWI